MARWSNPLNGIGGAMLPSLVLVALCFSDDRVFQPPDAIDFERHLVSRREKTLRLAKHAYACGRTRGHHVARIQGHDL